MFTGLSRDYPGTVPGLSRPFPEISWEFCLCVSLFLQEKWKHINNLTPTHFRDNPARLFMCIGLFLLRKESQKISHKLFKQPQNFHGCEASILMFPYLKINSAMCKLGACLKKHWICNSHWGQKHYLLNSGRIYVRSSLFAIPFEFP